MNKIRSVELYLAQRATGQRAGKARHRNGLSKYLNFFKAPRGGMVTCRSARNGLCQALLLAALIGAWGTANLMGQTPLIPVCTHLFGYAVHPRRSTHALHPAIDDGLTFCSAGLRTVEQLSFTALFLAITRFVPPGPAKDLLSVTQRRRE